MKLGVRYVCCMLLAALALWGTTGCGAGDPIAMSFGGAKVTKSMYAYWYSSYKNYLLNSLDGEDSVAYFALAGTKQGETIGDMYRERIDAMIKNNVASLYLYDQFNLQLSSSATTAVSQKISSEMAQAGGRAALNEKLAIMGLNTERYEKVLLAEEKIAQLYTYLYGDASQGISGAREISQEAYQTFYENNYVCVKHLLIRTHYKNIIDSDGYALTDEQGKPLTEPLSEAEQTAKEEKVAVVEKALAEGADFDALMEQYNEDSTAKTYQSGYLVASFSGFDKTFTSAALGLAEIGDTVRVETDAGVHFLQKCQLVDKPWQDSIYCTMLNRFIEYLQSDDFAAYTAQIISQIRENRSVLDYFNMEQANIAFFRT